MVEGEISFGRFRLDLARRELRRDKRLVRLGSRALDILCVLASAGGKVVSKDELMTRVWAGVVVEEHNIQVHISALRRAFEEDGDGESWILTVPGRGYRFLGSPGLPAPDKSAPASSLAVAGEPSLAVLPFLNLSGDPQQEYFADGMVEELITALSRIRWLFVTARNSSFAYKGQKVDVKRVGRELGVRYVLEGSVRKSGDRVRIAAQLIDANTGAHLWADHFDGPLEDVFDLQDNVAASVAGVIEPALQAAETARSTSRPTNDLTAYDLYLRAQAMAWSSARQIPEALGLLEQAIRRDPRYGPALAWAAFCCYRLLLDGRSDAPAIDRLKGVDFARRALEVAGDDPITLTNAAQALAYFGEDIDAMIALVDRALALNPNFARGWHSRAALSLNAGEPDMAIAHVETALRLSPGARVGTSLTVIGAAHFLARRFDEAVPRLLLAIQEDPSFPVPYRYLAACYAHMGRLAEAREILGRLRAVSTVVIPDSSHLRNLEHRELFLSGLRLASGENGSTETVSRRGDRARPAPSVADKSTPEGSLPVADRPSLAVLPFLNLSGDPGQEHFADGMVEEIITAVSQYPSLLVIARTSSFTYKGRAVEVKQIGRELGVRYVLEGSLRQAGNRIRVTAQLIEVETGNHLWAERYDRDLADIFAVQDEITQAVATAIAPAIADAELRRAIRRLPDSVDAWVAYQRGLWHLRKATADDNPLAGKFFQQAIDLDPTFSAAYGGLAIARTAAADFQGLPLSEIENAVESLARRAVALDPGNSEALSFLASILYRRGDFDGALAEAKRALAISPNLAQAHGVFGAILVFSGRPKEGLAALERYNKLDPRGPRRVIRLNQIALGLYFCRQYEAAVEMAREVIREYPDYPHSYRWLAAALGQLGRTDEAKRALEKAVAVAPAAFDMFVRQGVPWIRPQDHTHMVEGLKKAGWGG